MPLVDDRGRLFGRMNIIDAAVAAFVLLLIPLAYAAYLLFKVPEPVLTAATPGTFKNSENQYVQLTGQHLRPLLRAYAGTTAATYLFESPDRAQVRLPPLTPGVYDLILFNDAQEVAKIPGGITVTSPPLETAMLTASGMFTRLTPEQVGAVKQGARFSWPGGQESMEVVAVLPAAPDTVSFTANGVTAPTGTNKDKVPALVKMTTTVSGADLKAGGVPVAAGAELAVPAGGTSGNIAFAVERVYAARTTPVTLRIRFVTRPEVMELVRRDLAAAQREPEALRALRPELISATQTQDLLGTTKAELREGRIAVVEAVVRVPALRTPQGWSVDNKIVRAGGEYVFERPNYTLANGIILSLDAP